MANCCRCFGVMKKTEGSSKRNRCFKIKDMVWIVLLFACVCLCACDASFLTQSINTREEQSTNKVAEMEQQLSLPTFSVEGGFYEEEFMLKLTARGGQDVFYTLDGSDPRTSDTAILYDEEIRIYDNTTSPNRLSAITDITLGEYYPPDKLVDKGIIVRAVVKYDDGSFGAVATNSYFVGKKNTYYSEMKIVSMVTDEDYLFHPDTGFYMVGSGYYEWLNSAEYREYDSGDVQNPTNYNSDGRETEFPVSIQVFENGKAVYSADVGARISGNWSRAAVQKSFRLYARKEYGPGKMKYALFEDLEDVNGNLIQSFDKITIRNSGNDSQTLHFRDAFFQDLTKGLEVEYMDSEPCILFINGEFWGFYFLREKPDDEYIEAHYGIPKENVAVLKNGEVESGLDSDLNEFNELCGWAKNVDMSVDENYQRFCEKVDIQSFMDYVTVETYINNADWVMGYINNWQVWRDRAADGKWRFIFYDLDYSAGLYYDDRTDYTYDSLKNNRANNSVQDFMAILDNLMINPEFAEMFRENYLRIIDTYFAPEVVDELLDGYVEAYKSVTLDTFYRFGMGWAAESYDQSVAHMRNFFHKRPEYAKKYLEEFCKAERGGPKAMMAPVEQWGYYGDAEFTVKEEENAFCVSVPAATEESWNIQCTIHNITLTKGEKYRITFKASCTTPGEMSYGINRFDGKEYPSCFWDRVYLTEELKEYSVEFTMEKNTNYDWYLNFNFGDMAGDYVIKDVVMEKVE